MTSDSAPETTPPPAGLTPEDVELWDAAVSALRRTYRSGRHEVAAAVRTRSAGIHVGVHMAGSAGRTSICAEGMALGAVLAATPPHLSLAAEIDTVLAVLYRPGIGMRIVSACGVCRELLFDYCPDAWNYIHLPPEDGPSSPAPETVFLPEPERGIRETPGLAAGTAQRVRVRDLMPGKNIRAW
ncbi:hypothetical protein [Rhodococcus rhodochrous]|uniref:hypothetical protein n=1 Tax=Rhodococcus rhodochrous TaxID=1829 RepID=UPI001E38EBBE|nr:hypothetical protein [Rhodococcus rhodochrous]MCD2097076.1 hypothetical protein [Rhodococcus rhodochrous]MCD2120492.1 hypothetical protein [Rhodococcus rhodochrous]MCQ4133036.1 hypothetical protein [Rhodococcus rhodochrous]MDJ0017357.1 hypothetical protein [Rhodococcus rhodochrous]